VTGVLTVFFDVAYQSYLPALVDSDQLADGNSKLEISRSGAQIAGPGAAGVLIQALGAPVSVLADAVSFVLSALSVSRIKRAEPPIEPVHESERLTMRAEIGEGLRYVLGHRSLRLIAGCTATSNYFNSILQVVLLLYLVRTLHWSAGLIGLMFMIANVGFLIGAAVSARVQRRLRLGRTILVSIFATQVGGLIVGVSPRSHAFAWIVAGMLLTGLGNPIYNIAQVSYRQAITPNRMLGRMNATMRFMVWGTMPLGSLTGGVLAKALGLRPTLVIGAVGGLLAVLFAVAGPVRTLVDVAPVEAAA
jgi:Na+/melibiose symporter-like transporter